MFSPIVLSLLLVMSICAFCTTLRAAISHEDITMWWPNRDATTDAERWLLVATSGVVAIVLAVQLIVSW